MSDIYKNWIDGCIVSFDHLNGLKGSLSFTQDQGHKFLWFNADSGKTYLLFHDRPGEIVSLEQDKVDDD